MLERLNDQLLLKQQCLFGGGTAISLGHGEYRESVDIDFMCSSVEGYRGVRQLVTQSGMSWAFKSPVQVIREPKVDHYGIRCAVGLDSTPIKLEIVFEGRVRLTDPMPQDRICGVWTMAIEDLAATKLMANADRWADESTMSRDLIDLAMLVDGGELPAAGVDKARAAYGHSIDVSFEKARERLLDRPDRLRQCMGKMGMSLHESDLRTRVQTLSLGPGAPTSASRPRVRG